MWKLFVGSGRAGIWKRRNIASKPHIIVFNSSIIILQSAASSFCHAASIKRGLLRFWMAVRKHL